MVTRSSVARAWRPLYFTDFFFFSLTALSQMLENRHPRNFPIRRGLVLNRTFAIPISSKCPLKTNGTQNAKICTVFRAVAQVAVILQCEDILKSKTLALSADHSTVKNRNFQGLRGRKLKPLWSI